MPEPIFFASPAELAEWFRANHETAAELFLGIHKKHTGRPTVPWSLAVDEALCVGWIDGVTRALDEDRYVIRFTPRKPGSTWSKVNVRKMEALIAAGRVLPAGMAAWEKRTDARTGTYAFENADAAVLPPEAERAFRKKRKAWSWWEAQPAGYRRLAAWWIVSAKREETRARRLEQLIEHSARGERMPQWRRP